MADDSRHFDPVEREAHDLTRMLDSGRQTEQVANALREDSYNMAPRDFNRLVNSMQRTERQDYGDDIYRDRSGNVVISTGERQVVVATRDWEMAHRGSHERQSSHDQHNRGGHQRDAVTDGVVNGAIGAGIGAVIDGKKGAIAGGAAGVGNVVIDHVAGPNQRDPVADTVLKGAVGAGIGAIVDGKKGAIAGGAGSVGASVIDNLFNKKR